MYDVTVNKNSHCTVRILQFRVVKNVSGPVLSSRFFFLSYSLSQAVCNIQHSLLRPLWQTWLNFQIHLRSQMSKRTMSPLINTDETYVNYGLPWNYVLRMVYFGLLWFCVCISDCTPHCKLSINYRDYLNTFECKTITSFAQVIECAPTITEKVWDIILLISETHEGVKLV